MYVWCRDKVDVGHLLRLLYTSNDSNETNSISEIFNMLWEKENAKLLRHEEVILMRICVIEGGGARMGASLVSNDKCLLSHRAGPALHCSDDGSRPRNVYTQCQRQGHDLWLDPARRLPAGIVFIPSASRDCCARAKNRYFSVVVVGW